MFKLDLEKTEEPEIKLPTSTGSLKKQESSRKISTSALLIMPKPTNWKIFQKMGIPDHLTCLLRKLYAGQEATVRTRHGTMDWYQTGKGVGQGYILSPCLFNLHAEYSMWNAGLEEAQAGIKTAGRNINNLRYADDTTLMAESEKEQRASWWKWKLLLLMLSLQSCPTLCDPINGRPPGSPVPGILQTRTLEWVAIAFS